MAKVCHLMSQRDDIPNQVLKCGESLIIGRNRRCRIRDVKCSRSYCSVSFDGNTVCVDFTNTNQTISLLNGQTLTGNGFQYKIVLIHENNESNDGNNGEMDDTTGQQSNNSSDDNQFSYEELLPFPTNQTQKMSSETIWEILFSGRVHICRFLGGGQSSGSIAAFDFDGTLVDTKNGNKFPIDSNDWKLFDNSLPKRLEKLIEKGFRFVVISNQLALSNGRIKVEDIRHRFESALTAIGVPCLVMIAAYDDIYRKPRPGLWQLLSQQFNDKPIDLTNSFFVGDAAGRKKQLNGKSDHSSADLLFAANSCIPFLTPERFLSDVKPKSWDSTKTSYSGLTITTFRPQRIDSSYITTKIGSNEKFKDINELLANYSTKLHVIVFCGLSASGKTTFYSNHLKKFNYFYISRDELKTMEKCQKVCETQLNNNQNCVIDNTNVDPSARKKWVDICQKYCAIPLLFYFDISVEQSLHNNKFRRVIGVNSPVTDLVIRSQNKNFNKPTVNEGFESVFKINFVPKFETEEHQSIYFMYLFEK